MDIRIETERRRTGTAPLQILPLQTTREASVFFPSWIEFETEVEKMLHDIGIQEMYVSLFEGPYLGIEVQTAGYDGYQDWNAIVLKLHSMLTQRGESMPIEIWAASVRRDRSFAVTNENYTTAWNGVIRDSIVQVLSDKKDDFQSISLVHRGPDSSHVEEIPTVLISTWSPNRTKWTTDLLPALRRLDSLPPQWGLIWYKASTIWMKEDDDMQQWEDPQIVPGASIGPQGGDGKGSLGGFVTLKDDSDGSEKMHALTNFHVVETLPLRSMVMHNSIDQAYPSDTAEPAISSTPEAPAPTAGPATAPPAPNPKNAAEFAVRTAMCLPELNNFTINMPSDWETEKKVKKAKSNLALWQQKKNNEMPPLETKIELEIDETKKSGYERSLKLYDLHINTLKKEIQLVQERNRALGFISAISGYTTTKLASGEDMALDWALIQLAEASAEMVKQPKYSKAPSDPEDITALPGYSKAFITDLLAEGLPQATWTTWQLGSKTEVFKVGRTTGWTQGTINLAKPALRRLTDTKTNGADYGKITVCVRVEPLGQSRPFADKGDSGAWVMDSKSGAWVGLLFGGTNDGGVDSGSAFITPAELVVASIESTTGKTVKLPRRVE